MPPGTSHWRQSRWVGVGLVVLGSVSAAFWCAMPYLRGVAIRLDTAQPYRIELGRGSGWHGLDTVQIRDDGIVILHRLTPPGDAWETATLVLPQQSVTRVLNAVEENRLLSLEKAYHGGVEDGTQWVFRVQHGDQEKAVYCNNFFPEPIVQFAATLDQVLAENGLEGVAWHRVAYLGRRMHERELWSSISR
jgi:hypothetical protein